MGWASAVREGQFVIDWLICSKKSESEIENIFDKTSRGETTRSLNVYDVQSEQSWDIEYWLSPFDSDVIARNAHYHDYEEGSAQEEANNIGDAQSKSLLHRWQTAPRSLP